MIAFCKSLVSARLAALLAVFVLVLVATSAVVVRAGATGSGTSAHAVPATVTPYAEFQNSTLTGSTNTIAVSNLPVVTSTGSVIYDNVTIQFDVAADGTLTVGSTQITAAPSVEANAFEAGTYQQAGAGEFIVVSGPGITNGGSTEWSFATTSGACVSQYSAAWYVGPIKNSPYYARIKAAGVSLTGFSYGIGGGTPSCNSTTWAPNSLLGFSQTGGQMSILSFTLNGVDQNQQVAQVSYSLQ